jgi:FkbH-like protein
MRTALRSIRAQLDVHLSRLSLTASGAGMTIEAAPNGDSGVAADVLAAAEQAQREGRTERALELYLEALAATELPSADLCLKIARCHDRLGATEDAVAWLVQVVDVSESFLHWSAAAKTLARLTQRARPAARLSRRLAVTGSYTTSQLAAMLPLVGLRFGVDIVVHESLYGQYQQDLIDPDSALYRSDPELIVVAVHEGATRLPSYSEEPEAAVATELQRWSDVWDVASRRSGGYIVQHNFAVRPDVPLGHLSSGIVGSRYAMLQALNRELAAAASGQVSIVDCDRLASDFGRHRWFDDRYWFRSKQAVALDALPMLARHTAAVIAGRLGLSRKCLVLDLDNTLWGGVIGEDGIEGIVLGGDGIGEAYVAFQEYVLELKERGVILAVASKNNEGDAREVFERHPEMRIRLEDISVFAVNWEDKPANMRRIAQTLDLGLDALVLADDNPAERQIVRRLVPEVDVLALPVEPAGFRRVLADYLGFESPAFTTEDRARTAQYHARAEASELRSSAADIESFYRDLRMRAVVAPFDELHLPRIEQLVGKTNQFNLTTRRHSGVELRAFMASDSHLTRYLRLVDRFGDHGLVAVLIGVIEGGVIDIDTFLMSCRVIGRTVEAQLLAHLCAEAQAMGCRTLRGTYVPTAKNAIVRDLYERFGFRRIGDRDGVTSWEYDLRSLGPITNGYIAESTT